MPFRVCRNEACNLGICWRLRFGSSQGDKLKVRMRRIAKRPTKASQHHRLDFLIISFGLHILLGAILTSSFFRDVAGKFGVESLAVSPMSLRESGEGEMLIVDYVPEYSAEQWREDFSAHLKRPSADVSRSSLNGEMGKTSAEIDPNKDFVTCREFRCVASSKRGSHGRMHWVHVTNVNRVERKYDDGPFGVIVPIVVTETSEPLSIYVSSDADVEFRIVGAPGVRVARVVYENRGSQGFYVTGEVHSTTVDQSGQNTRLFLTRNIKSNKAVDHFWHTSPEITPPRLSDPRWPKELAGFPPAPMGGPDQIVDVEDVIGKSTCKDRNIYVGSDQSFDYDVEKSEGGGGSILLVAKPPADFFSPRYEVIDPCSKRKSGFIRRRGEEFGKQRNFRPYDFAAKDR